MNRKIFVGGLTAAGVIAVAAASASATVIGGSSQSSQQGANATQLANATTATGTAIVVGGGGGGPTSTQGSDNELSSGQAVGSSAGGDVFIATGSGPTQLNEQGANTQQVSANGAIGLQGSKNGLANSQIVGGDQSCLPPAGCASSVIIGSPTQVNEQGANLTQSADGGVVTGDIIITPTVVINGPAGPIVQLSFQPITSSQIILG